MNEENAWNKDTALGQIQIPCELIRNDEILKVLMMMMTTTTTTTVIMMMNKVKANGHTGFYMLLSIFS